MAQFNDQTGTLTIDEYELHDLVVEMAAIDHTANRALTVEGGELDWVNQIQVQIKDLDKTPKDKVQKWTSKVNALIVLLQQMDGELHDDLEHTC